MVTAPQYRVQVGRLNRDLIRFLPEWQEFIDQQGSGLVFRDPSWLMELYRYEQPKVRREDLLVFFLERLGRTVGVMPYVLVQWPLECLFGEFSLASLPMRRMCLPFSDANLPEDGAAYDAVFESVINEAGPAYDMIYFEDIRVGSFLWDYLHESPLVRQSFSIYVPDAPDSHSLIQMGSSFDEYLKKYTSKTRSTLKRKVRKLKKKGELEVVRVTALEQVGPFVDEAAVVSRKSYQYNLFGAGIRDPEQFKRELWFIAEHGWLRCYLLRCDGVATSFMIGYQDKQNFYYIDVAFDQQWTKDSVGTVLQYLVLEDLYAHEPPTLFDFCGGHGEHKVFFENDSYPGTDAFLFPRRPYPRLAQTALQATVQATRGASAVLERYNLKARVKRAIRMGSVLLGRDGQEDRER